MKNIIKNKTIFIMLIFILAITLFHINVYAETDLETEKEAETTQWTDFSNVEIELTKSYTSGHVTYNLNVKNVTYKKGHSYDVYINNSLSKPSESDGAIGEHLGSTILNINKYLEKSGDIYLWIDEHYVDENKTLLEAYKIERPSQNPLGERITGSFYGKSSMIFFLEPTETSNNRKVKVKIGTVTDTEILKQIQNGNASALSNLLTYAKSASSLTTATLNVGTSETSIISGLNLTEGGYYYVYLEADDENGTYYPVEDVSLYQYCYYSDNDGQLVDYLSDDFKWGSEENASNPVEDAKKDTTVTEKILPNTGASVFIVATLVVILLMISVSFYFKYAKYRGIK